MFLIFSVCEKFATGLSLSPFLSLFFFLGGGGRLVSLSWNNSSNLNFSIYFVMLNGRGYYVQGTERNMAFAEEAQELHVEYGVVGFNWFCFDN